MGNSDWDKYTREDWKNFCLNNKKIIERKEYRLNKLEQRLAEAERLMLDFDENYRYYQSELAGSWDDIHSSYMGYQAKWGKE